MKLAPAGEVDGAVTIGPQVAKLQRNASCFTTFSTAYIAGSLYFLHAI